MRACVRVRVRMCVFWRARIREGEAMGGGGSGETCSMRSALRRCYHFLGLHLSRALLQYADEIEAEDRALEEKRRRREEGGCCLLQ